jgi:hypothetical protein
MNISWMEPKYIFAVIVLVMLISIPIGIYLERRKKKSLALRNRFGAEYDHAVIVHGSEQKAEAKLLDRAARVESLKIHDLAPTERSVNHPQLMQNYRSAHGIATRPGPAQATTEELRAAMIHYRSIFDDLIQAQAPIERTPAA